ncbi:MAG: GtrA family protein [Oscillospiraceae bacterium]|nr:GtrA family protein [Oscillospiraceae bacterium]
MTFYNKIKELYKKYREIISYVFFGGLTTVVSLASRFISQYLFEQYSPEFLGATTLAATTVAWICAVTFAFIVNKVFVFQNKDNKAADWFKQAATFYGARLTTYFMELGFMLLTVDVLKFNMYIMSFIAQVFILVGNYLLSKFLIFRKRH